MKGRPAPQLFHDKPDPKPGMKFVVYPQDLLKAINHLCTYNEQKVLLTLLGCKGDGSFCPSTEYILDMTGIKKPNHYFTIRKDLEDKKYILIEDGCIYVQTENILADYKIGKPKTPKAKLSI